MSSPAALFGSQKTYMPGLLSKLQEIARIKCNSINLWLMIIYLGQASNTTIITNPSNIADQIAILFVIPPRAKAPRGLKVASNRS